MKDSQQIGGLDFHPTLSRSKDSRNIPSIKGFQTTREDSVHSSQPPFRRLVLFRRQSTTPDPLPPQNSSYRQHRKLSGPATIRYRASLRLLTSKNATNHFIKFPTPRCNNRNKQLHSSKSATPSPRLAPWILTTKTIPNPTNPTERIPSNC
ncbi:hypothetical protein Mapa_010260 [Marchantia paleacea]|nr:hypothetical protein Mapa_010260 [Marchantia paleacea]